MNSKKWLEYLFGLKKGTKKGVDLEKVVSLFSLFGSPHKKFPTVHVAGTNGKGSVSLKSAKALSKEGKKVGLFISPHILSIHERIQINGEPIAEKRFTEILNRIGLKNMKHEQFFTIMTLVAFIYFAEEKVDIAVIEVGIGGLKDATNIITPEVSVITTIGFDHMDMLGNTLDAIAENKAGIIKPFVPVVVGPKAIREPILKKAKQMDAPLIQVNGDFIDYEKENNAIAKAVLTVLGVSNEAIEYGLGCTMPGRFQLVDGVIYDCAHNEEGIKALLAKLDKEKKYFFIMGFTSGRDTFKLLSLVEPFAETILLPEVEGPSQLIRFDEIEKGNIPCERIGSLESALVIGKKSGNQVVACGSCYLISALFVL